MKTIKKGDKFIVTSGSYSDYTINSCHIAEKTFNLKEAYDEYKEYHKIVAYEIDEVEGWDGGREYRIRYKTKDSLFDGESWSYPSYNEAKEWVDRRDYGMMTESAFIAWLNRGGYIKESSVGVLYIDFDDFDVLCNHRLYYYTQEGEE
jgi:hypothetical protein